MAAANVKDRLDTHTQATRRTLTVVLVLIVVLASIVIGIASVVFAPPASP
ncbi:MAG: hypothetical protein OXH99_07780 [Bryobacterales bacterium]|nr:hypothetical protein [Bryobacterales bacterium]